MRILLEKKGYSSKRIRFPLENETDTNVGTTVTKEYYLDTKSFQNIIYRYLGEIEACFQILELNINYFLPHTYLAIDWSHKLLLQICICVGCTVLIWDPLNLLLQLPRKYIMKSLLLALSLPLILFFESLLLWTTHCTSPSFVLCF